MRRLLISSIVLACLLAGCATQDQTSAPAVLPSDNSTKPGSGPGAPPGSGNATTGPSFIE